MGVLQKIIGRQGEKPFKSDFDTETKPDPQATSPPVPSPVDSPAPQPCDSCNGTNFWFDVYGGGPHCTRCRRPPAESLIARSRDIAPTADGSFGWPDQLPDSQRTVVDLEREWHSKWRTYSYTTREGEERFVIERRDFSFVRTIGGVGGG